MQCNALHCTKLSFKKILLFFPSSCMLCKFSPHILIIHFLIFSPMTYISWEYTMCVNYAKFSSWPLRWFFFNILENMGLHSKRTRAQVEPPWITSSMMIIPENSTLPTLTRTEVSQFLPSITQAFDCSFLDPKMAWWALILTIKHIIS